ncbi:MAG: hypothetical protein IPP73_03505 [Chitinophagaceae bacterium]|nr:hypothetical protein [Chitinophagaceae bacterium]
MADKNLQDMESHEVVIAKAKDFWTRFSKPIVIISTLVIVGGGGWYAYNNFVKKPKEKKDADLGKNDDALSYYKKAAYHFEKDQTAAAEYLFDGAYLADRVMKNSKVAIELYKEVKDKFPGTQQALMAENYLAQLGVYNIE